MRGHWCAEQAVCSAAIERHQSADDAYLVDDVRLLELAQNARKLFEMQESREKRRLLDYIVSNCSWANGRLSVELKQPFDLIAEVVKKAASVETKSGPEAARSEVWLGERDSNPHWRSQSPQSYR